MVLYTEVLLNQACAGLRLKLKTRMTRVECHGSQPNIQATSTTIPINRQLKLLQLLTVLCLDYCAFRNRHVRTTTLSYKQDL